MLLKVRPDGKQCPFSVESLTFSGVREGHVARRSPRSADDLGSAVTFILLGSTGVAPMVHAAMSPSMSLLGFPTAHIIATSLLYLTGTLFYTSRFPEKVFPTIFDTWVCRSAIAIPQCLTDRVGQGASHQIFHILVNVGQVCFLVGLRAALLQRYIKEAVT